MKRLFSCFAVFAAWAAASGAVANSSASASASAHATGNSSATARASASVGGDGKAMAVTGAALARETLDLISLQDRTLVTAVRQREGRDGAADFRKFILEPITRVSDQWLAQSASVRLTFLPCATALQEHENYARDSFKAGNVGRPSSLRSESIAACRAEMGRPAAAGKKRSP